MQNRKAPTQTYKYPGKLKARHTSLKIESGSSVVWREPGKDRSNV
jgi:hypothetical protein